MFEKIGKRIQRREIEREKNKYFRKILIELDRKDMAMVMVASCDTFDSYIEMDFRRIAVCMNCIKFSESLNSFGLKQ